MQLVLDRDPHQLVVRGVVLDRVDAVAEAVVGVQHRRVLVGGEAPADALGGAGQLAELVQLLRRPSSRRGARYRLGERGVGAEDVVALERRWLVEDVVRGHTGPGQTRSMIVPVPSPPPQHIVTRPSVPSVRSSSCSAVVTSRAPVAPTG